MPWSWWYGSECYADPGLCRAAGAASSAQGARGARSATRHNREPLQKGEDESFGRNGLVPTPGGAVRARTRSFITTTALWPQQLGVV